MLYLPVEHLIELAFQPHARAADHHNVAEHTPQIDAPIEYRACAHHRDRREPFRRTLGQPYFRPRIEQHRADVALAQNIAEAG